MSDSFADLWKSTAPSNSSSSTQQTLGSAARNVSRSGTSLSPNTKSNTFNNNKYDAFTALASSSRPASRPITPSTTNSSPKPVSSIRIQPASPSTKPSAQSGSGAGLDTFSSLLGSSFSSSNGPNLSIAQKQAASERAREEQRLREREAVTKQGMIWDGLDKIASSSKDNTLRSGGAQVSSRTGGANDDLFSFDDLTTSSHPQQSSHTQINTAPNVLLNNDSDVEWDLSEVSSALSTQVEAAASRSPTPNKQIPVFEALDDFLSSPLTNEPKAQHSTSHRSLTSPIPNRSETNSPGDFDFGDREYHVQEDDNGSDVGDENDNILGELGSPVTSKSSQLHSFPQARPARSSPRGTSPPPHVLGKIVEMGFSVEQAKVALASTDTGMDVEAALETLLGQTTGEDEMHSDAYGRVDDERHQHSEESVELQQRHRPESKRPSEHLTSPHSDRPAPRRAPPSSSSISSNTASLNAEQLQQHADRLLSQASDFGLSVWKNANVMWKEGKEKVVKAYEEQTKGSRSPGASTLKGGKQPTASRPKWMQDAALDEDEDTNYKNKEGAGVNGQGRRNDEFKDHDDFANIPESSFLDTKPQPSQIISANQPVDQSQRKPHAQQRQGTKVELLGAIDEPAFYASPARRRVRAPTTETEAYSTSGFSQSLPPASYHPSKPVKPVYISPTIPSTTLQSVLKYKSAATTLFTEGQFSSAADSYSKAIDLIPEDHLLRVLMFNNRALTRIKIGDAQGAEADCSIALSHVERYFDYASPSASPIDIHLGSEVLSLSFSDAFVKSHKRRAEALEMREKWVKAGEDWNMILKCGWVGKALRDEAVRGVGRCRRMIAGNERSEFANNQKVEQKALGKPKPSSYAPTTVSVAAESLRQTYAAQETEEALKHTLKDSTDTRLLAWKAGKEANIRALIASLDSILWAELGWQKVGMHELVTDKQVKVRYMKAIARVHPDKLNVSNTTIEQRMIANGVFSALNDAWNAFKP